MKKYKQDIAWLRQAFISKHGVEPTETKIDSFIEKVAIFHFDGYSELMARKMAFKILDF
jgi:hypothetical protein